VKALIFRKGNISIGAEDFVEDCTLAVDEAARLMALVAKEGLR